MEDKQPQSIVNVDNTQAQNQNAADVEALIDRALDKAAVRFAEEVNKSISSAINRKT